MMRSVASFLRRSEGVTAIEYAFLASLIALVVIAAMVLAGDALGTLWDSIGECVVSLGRNCG